MAFALNELAQLLGSSNTVTGIVTAAANTTLVVATANGARVVKTNDTIIVGDRVLINSAGFAEKINQASVRFAV